MVEEEETELSPMEAAIQVMDEEFRYEQMEMAGSNEMNIDEY